MPQRTAAEAPPAQTEPLATTPVPTPLAPDLGVAPFGSVDGDDFSTVAAQLGHWQVYALRLQRRLVEVLVENAALRAAARSEQGVA